MFRTLHRLSRYNINHNNYHTFANRHIGIKDHEIRPMLKICNTKTMNDLITETIPDINKHILKETPSIKESDTVKKIKQIMDKNIQPNNYIGMGYTSSILPDVIKRNILENPRWYTAYTPYQSEISQGRLESLNNYQTVITDLTGLDISNASLLDEASSAGEVVNMFVNITKNKKHRLFCSSKIHPYILDVIKTKTNILNIELNVCDISTLDETDLDSNTLGLMFQYPDTYGNIDIPFKLLEICRNKNILTACNTNLLALTKFISPGELGVDIAYGNAMNLGVPLWFGGPHPAFISCKHKYIRQVPGRIIGESVDTRNNKAYRIGLQTREQHIKRDKATSNICTSQALLANVVAMYSVYHGRDGLMDITNSIINKTNKLNNLLASFGIDIKTQLPLFDTIVIKDSKCPIIYNKLLEENIVVRKINDREIGITFDETTTADNIHKIFEIITSCFKINYDDYDDFKSDLDNDNDNILKNVCNIDTQLYRKTDFLIGEVFKNYHTETELMRYINYLDKKDFTLCDGMMPLGSCTMKLNSASQLQPLSWDSVMNIHPYTPSKFTKGYHEIIDMLSEKLKNITGFTNVSYQPNSGAMGEYSGLLCIKKYHESRKDNRDICVIPNSAHGTNFASAKLARFNIVKYEDNISISEFENLIETHKDNLGCFMITYPGTNGVFQKNIKKIIEIVHKNGGLVYMDGANMNAQVGLTSPAECGADVCHLNLHKTFCIPHGGGGPGMGPILCNDKLGKYLPMNNLQMDNLQMDNLQINNNSSEYKDNIGNITASQWSSASILTIPLMYIMEMGSYNLKKSTEIAILNANYMKSSLEPYYNIIDYNENERVGHEFIIDVQEFYKYGITEVDISKRLIDYSFHPPTMSWPRKAAIMIEPTESESRKELDRFIESMIKIRTEIQEVIDGKYGTKNNVLKNAPHALTLINDEWDFPYSQQKAFYPIEGLKFNKHFPSINRVDDVYGDRKLLSNPIKCE